MGSKRLQVRFLEFLLKLLFLGGLLFLELPQLFVYFEFSDVDVNPAIRNIFWQFGVRIFLTQEVKGILGLVLVVLQFGLVILLSAQLAQPLAFKLEFLEHTAVLSVGGVLHTLLEFILDALQQVNYALDV